MALAGWWTCRHRGSVKGGRNGLAGMGVSVRPEDTSEDTLSIKVIENVLERRESQHN